MLINQDFGPIRQGDTFRANYALEDASGAPLLLADMSAAVVTWRWSSQNGGPALGADVAATMIAGTGGQAVAQVLVPTANDGKFYYELKMVVSGDTSTPATGHFTVDQQISPYA